MKQKLWKLAFVSALLKTRLDCFHGRMDGDGTLEAQEAASISTQINLAIPETPMHGSVNAFLTIPWKSPLPLVTQTHTNAPTCIGVSASKRDIWKMAYT